MVIKGFSPYIKEIPEFADPEGSIRYCNVDIMHEQIECKHNEVTFYDNICKDNTFIIEDKSPDYSGYQCRYFKGYVLKEKDGDYSWWKKPIRKQ